MLRARFIERCEEKSIDFENERCKQHQLIEEIELKLQNIEINLRKSNADFDSFSMKFELGMPSK